MRYTMISSLKNLASSLRAFLLLLVLGGALVLLNALQILSLIIWPFSRKVFRRANLVAAHLFWKLCVFFIENVLSIEMVFSGDKIPRGENVILFCNHQQMLDILALMPLADRNGQLANLKWFAKDPIKYVPGVGWGMLFLDCIFLKRDWTQDASRIRKTFAKLLKHGLPFWLISFSEGTRLTDEKLKRSQDFSLRNGFPVFNHVLVPRTRGFVASLTALRLRADAVYDVTIGYDQGVLSLWQVFKGEVRRIHLDVRRFPVSILPQGEREITDWLMQRFTEKDSLMKHFYAYGRFSL